MSARPKHDFYQTEAQVVVEVRIKGLAKKDVEVEFEAKRVCLKTTGEPKYELELNLAHPINPEESHFSVRSTKVEVRLQKLAGIRWDKLEGDGSDPLQPAGNAAGAQRVASCPSYPSSSGRDWNKITSELSRELESEKPEGEQALNEMFQKIYADGSDDLRKAMNKSFAESGGTVLSTNWDEIGKKKTDVKPPEGMEYKKWDD